MERRLVHDMNTYILHGHKRGTKEKVSKPVKATTVSAAKNKVPKSLVLERVRLEGGKKRTKAQRARAGAGKSRHHFNRVAFGI
jgi:hypothetical protein